MEIHRKMTTMKVCRSRPAMKFPNPLSRLHLLVFVVTGVCKHERRCHLQDGTLISCCWKGWTRGNSPLRWEVRRLLPCCGYTSTARHTEGAKLKDNWGTWKTHLQNLGLATADSDFGDSKRTSKRSASSSETIEEVHWFSTRALLGFLLYLSRNKGDRAGKVRNAALLEGLLLNTLAADDARTLVSIACTQEQREKCRRYSPEAETCPHSLVIDAADRPPQVALSGFLLEAFSLWGECLGIKVWALHILGEIAAGIDKNVESYADYGYHTSSDAFLMGPSGKKRKIMDPHCKTWAAMQVSTSNQPSHASAVRSLPNVNKSMGTIWRQQHLSALRAAMHMQFQHPCSVALVLDASRVGRPSRELLCGVVSDCSGSHAVLPPQVLS
eukprot:5880998-Amphidinium_carterae.5